MQSTQTSMTCLRGRHKWREVKPDGMALVRGEVVMRQRCERCGKERNRAR